MTIKISHAALSELESTPAWVKSSIPKKAGFSAEEIYGPEGKLNWRWSLRSNDAENMRVDLCGNIGGGVQLKLLKNSFAFAWHKLLESGQIKSDSQSLYG
ncbi:MAG: hypothetical protein WA090_04915 [Candidatus Nanopelagicaceae bacterium]